MFRSAVVKLTLWYVGALFLVCLLFSVPAYNIASASLRRGAERQTNVIRRVQGGVFGPNIAPQLEEQRELQLGEDRHQLIQSLALFNIAIIGLGSVASYWFARRTLRPIEEAHQAQSRFTADASHELRTPLATMQAEIDVALRDKSLNVAGARTILESNLEEIARLRLLSEQLLSLTRWDDSSKVFSTVNMAKVIGPELDAIEAKYGIEINRKMTKKALVYGDSTLLKQLLHILVSNAVVYAAPSDPLVGVEVRKSKDNTMCMIVSDQGPGISASDLPQIFKRFYRGSNASKHGVAGHGLGLALAKQITEAHHGTIDVKSNEGKGTSFTIELPLDAT